MRKETILNEILRSPASVFTFSELLLMFPKTKEVNLRKQISYYCKQGSLIRLRRGIYAKDNNFDPYELAVKIYNPSYISFETVLRNEGVIFQNYSTIFVASKITRMVEVGDLKIQYIKIPDRALGNSLGLIKKDFYTIASKERAMSDILYKNKKYHFDNTSSVNTELLNSLKNIYE